MSSLKSDNKKSIRVLALIIAIACAVGIPFAARAVFGTATAALSDPHSDVEIPVSYQSMEDNGWHIYEYESFVDGTAHPYEAPEEVPMPVLEVKVTADGETPTSSADGTGYAKNSQVKYSWTVSNTGNVPLTVTTEDNLISSNNKSIGTIAAGDTKTFSLLGDVYSVTEADVSAGHVTHIITAKATYDGKSITATGTCRVPTCTETDNRIMVNAFPTTSPANGTAYAVGEKITYGVEVINNGANNVSNVLVSMPELGKTGSNRWSVGNLDKGSRGYDTFDYVVKESDRDGYFTATFSASADGCPSNAATSFTADKIRIVDTPSPEVDMQPCYVFLGADGTGYSYGSGLKNASTKTGAVAKKWVEQGRKRGIGNTVIIDNRVGVAMNSTYGEPGDYVDLIYADDHVVRAIIVATTPERSSHANPTTQGAWARYGMNNTDWSGTGSMYMNQKMSVAEFPGPADLESSHEFSDFTGAASYLNGPISKVVKYGDNVTSAASYETWITGGEYDDEPCPDGFVKIGPYLIGDSVGDYTVGGTFPLEAGDYDVSIPSGFRATITTFQYQNGTYSAAETVILDDTPDHGLTKTKLTVPANGKVRIDTAKSDGNGNYPRADRTMVHFAVNNDLDQVAETKLTSEPVIAVSDNPMYETSSADERFAITVTQQGATSKSTAVDPNFGSFSMRFKLSSDMGAAPFKIIRDTASDTSLRPKVLNMNTNPASEVPGTWSFPSDTEAVFTFADSYLSGGGMTYNGENYQMKAYVTTYAGETDHSIHGIDANGDVSVKPTSIVATTSYTSSNNKATVSGTKTASKRDASGVKIVLPTLNLTKSADIEGVNAFCPINYTVIATNSKSGTKALGVVIEDNVQTGLVIDMDTIKVNGSSPATTPTKSNGKIIVVTGKDLAYSESVTLTYTAYAGDPNTSAASKKSVLEALLNAADNGVLNNTASARSSNAAQNEKNASAGVKLITASVNDTVTMSATNGWVLAETENDANKSTVTFRFTTESSDSDAVLVNPKIVLSSNLANGETAIQLEDITVDFGSTHQTLPNGTGATYQHNGNVSKSNDIVVKATVVVRDPARAAAYNGDPGLNPNQPRILEDGGIKLTATLSADNVLSPASGTYPVIVNIPELSAQAITVSNRTPSAEDDVMVSSTFFQTGNARLDIPQIRFTETGDDVSRSAFQNVKVEKSTNGGTSFSDMPTDKYAVTRTGGVMTVTFNESFFKDTAIRVTYVDKISSGTASNGNTVGITANIFGTTRTAGATAAASSYTVQAPSITSTNVITSPLIDGVPAEVINVGDSVFYRLSTSQSNVSAIGRDFRATVGLDSTSAANGVYFNMSSVKVMSGTTDVTGHYNIVPNNADNPTAFTVTGKEGYEDIRAAVTDIAYHVVAGASNNEALRGTQFTVSAETSITNSVTKGTPSPITTKIADAAVSVTKKSNRNDLKRGDTVSYTIELRNTDSEPLSKIKKLIVLDELSNSAYRNGFKIVKDTVKVTLNGSDITSSGNIALTWPLDNDKSFQVSTWVSDSRYIELQVGDRLVITYDASAKDVSSIVPSQSFSNTVLVAADNSKPTFLTSVVSYVNSSSKNNSTPANNSSNNSSSNTNRSNGSSNTNKSNSGGYINGGGQGANANQSNGKGGGSSNTSQGGSSNGGNGQQANNGGEMGAQSGEAQGSSGQAEYDGQPSGSGSVTLPEGNGEITQAVDWQSPTVVQTVQQITQSNGANGTSTGSNATPAKTGDMVAPLMIGALALGLSAAAIAMIWRRRHNA